MTRDALIKRYARRIVRDVTEMRGKDARQRQISIVELYLRTAIDDVRTNAAIAAMGDD